MTKLELTRFDISIELIMTPQIKRPEHRDGRLPPPQLSIIKISIREWQIDLAFLKDKSALLQMLVKMSGLRGKRVVDKEENLQKELWQMEYNTIPSFEEKLKEYKRSLKLLDSHPRASLESSYDNFRKFQSEWKNLYQKFKSLEIRILEALIEGYPIFIY